MECESINKETPEMKQLISGIQKEGASLITPPPPLQIILRVHKNVVLALLRG